MSKIIIELSKLVPTILRDRFGQILEDDHVWRIIIVPGYLGLVGIHGKGYRMGEYFVTNSFCY